MPKDKEQIVKESSAVMYAGMCSLISCMKKG